MLMSRDREGADFTTAASFEFWMRQ